MQALKSKYNVVICKITLIICYQSIITVVAGRLIIVITCYIMIALFMKCLIV